MEEHQREKYYKTTMKLNFHAPINVTSYGYCGLSILKELIKISDTALTPIGPIDVDNQEDADILSKLINERLYSHFGGGNSLFFHPQSTTIKLWHQHDLSQSIQGRPYIGFPIFELTKFSQLELASLQSCDYLFVPSQWGRNILIKELGVEWEKKIYTVPLGVDTSVFYPTKRDKNEKFRILVVGKIEIRKSIEKIAEVFNLAFGNNDNVELVMSVDNPFIKPEEYKEWVNFYKNTPLGDKITFIPRVKTRNDLSNVMRSCDCFLTLSKCEGWDLPALEALSCGLPVIATNYSAHTEFLSSDNSLLIEIDELEPAFDNRWFHSENVEDGAWAKIGDNQINQCVDYIRSLYHEWLKASSTNLVNYPGVQTAKKYTWTNTAKKILSNLSIIEEYYGRNN